MIDDKERKLIKTFFEQPKEMEDAKLIRSSKYLGDIGEYLASKIYGIELADNQKNQGYDGIRKDGKRFQVKLNNSKGSTNQEIGDPSKYDYLVLLITSNSLIYDEKYKDSNNFACVYKICKEDLVNLEYIAKTFIKEHTPEFLIDRDLNIEKNSKS
jgi:hypothetical protein